MPEIKEKPAQTNPEIAFPEWFGKYKVKLQTEKMDLLAEVSSLATMDRSKLKDRLGGDIAELPYEILETLFITGSDHAEVADLLRSKRVGYVKIHPERSKGVPGIEQGISTFDGRFIPKREFDQYSDSEKRGALVGSGCFHYMTGPESMSSDPSDYWPKPKTDK